MCDFSCYVLVEDAPGRQYVVKCVLDHLGMRHQKLHLNDPITHKALAELVWDSWSITLVFSQM